MSEIDVAVWGGTGLVGQELVGILEKHPDVGDIRQIGREMPDDLDPSEAAFLALPHGVSGKVVGQLAEAGHDVIDLSGDMRFKSAADYAKWYGQEHPAPEWLPAMYSLPEFSRESIQGEQILSIPGCYPTGTLLGTLPLLDGNLVKQDSSIDIFALSGYSGRGKISEAEREYLEDNAVPYGTGHEHRHVGEIEQFLGGRAVGVFSPKVLPFERGMLVETKLKLYEDVETGDVAQAFEEAYRDEPLVDILEEGSLPDIKSTVGTDGCRIGFIVVDGYALVVSSLDNLRKGAASQAVQAFNVSQGLDELAGLKPLTTV